MAELKDYSTSAGSNNSASPNGWPENMAPSGVNNSDRELAARIARWLADNNGSLATGGTSTAITVTLNQQFSAWFDGLTFASRITTTCGATPTINPTGSGALGAKSLYWAGSGTQLAANELVSTSVAIFMYEATSDKVYVYGASGLGVIGPASATDNALVRFDSTTGKLIQNSSFATLSDAGALTITGASAAITSQRNGGSPLFAADRTDTHGDLADLGQYQFYGRDSASAQELYAAIPALCISDNAGAEQGQIGFQTVQSGTYANRAYIGAGIFTASTTDPGADKINASEYQISGRIVKPFGCWGYVTVSGGTPTLADSDNVTSITDTATGQLTVTIATDHANANYGVTASFGDATGAKKMIYEITGSRAAGSFLLECTTSASTSDPAAWSFGTVGDFA